MGEADRDRKIYANAVVFFNIKMTSIETYQENSGNLEKKNGLESANAAIKIANSLKELLQEHMSSNDDKPKQSKNEHLLQMSMLRTANQR